MADISLETVAGKLNRVGYDAFLQSLRHARSEGNRNVELSHWLFHIVQNPKSDLSVTLDHFKLDRARMIADLGSVIGALRKNATDMPQIAEQLTDILDRGWHYATLMFGEAQIRTGHILVAALKNSTLKRDLVQLSKVFGQLNVDTLVNEARTAWADSDEEDMRPMDGSGIGAPAGGGAAAPGQGGTTALGRFAVDMTAVAASGKMDPIVGRDDEIRQIVDILLRRRQNNPILTGEAGVGKTAVVEGFAQRLAANEVPPKLQGTKLFMLDLGLMQAGASMKGEFEQRLRSVIDEVQGSPVPIILFIDEIHTLMGAGGAAGTGDAANLLKPALARGTLRTIGATTWMEYAKYFEKDPAMTRRFQPVNIDEPSLDRAAYMLRGILAPMETHHGVRISDEAVVAAVNLSARYIPSRQLPDKAVSLLDTACARVAISQSTEPATIQDCKARIAGLETELGAKERQADLGEDAGGRVAEIHDLLVKERSTLAALEAEFAEEKALVDQLLDVWKKMASPTAAPADGVVQEGDVAGEPETLRPQAMESVKRLQARPADSRKIYAHVDAQAVAAVISDWTGIPAGKMVSDELQAILQLAERLKERVIGQDHGLEMISTRIQTASAKLANPNKPIGVFMLCGPSGVGKTETALALAEAVYGGEQNIITINMSEFQEAHTVSLLKGAPPGYVGYGEGGRLTEAVRRKPYSVVLLDEVEKAHSDVHELFFQVFDKGIMEDGSGRQINFKNTLILLTSNVGTDAIMDLAEKGETRPELEALEEVMKPHLLRVFPPALLGRIVTIPYFPLSTEVLAGITKLKLNAIVKRMKENHGAAMVVSPEVITHIVDQCRDPDSGGRMVDNIISNTILPRLSREVLNRMVAQSPMTRVELVLQDGEIGYDFA
ncbi:type VI secretion system ATPase TssH [Tabrizicola fusiformis]|uniref:type VI secretion system ATPase TssH n=1 Tax=Tabrizicola sp. SY72 TaxID=2741673 RepID=UPI001574B3F8|nr:type VI secretion system ATPase TssH [Tabrizicola sp. SY72]NTT84294.1 type VI secretion system ATPase TssH [Tabrizicola sp. SY72]